MSVELRFGVFYGLSTYSVVYWTSVTCPANVTICRLTIYQVNTTTYSQYAAGFLKCFIAIIAIL